jgi:hypothetical protein
MIFPRAARLNDGDHMRRPEARQEGFADTDKES